MLCFDKFLFHLDLLFFILFCLSFVFFRYLFCSYFIPHFSSFGNRTNDILTVKSSSNEFSDLSLSKWKILKERKSNSNRSYVDNCTSFISCFGSNLVICGTLKRRQSFINTEQSVSTAYLPLATLYFSANKTNPTTSV